MLIINPVFFEFIYDESLDDATRRTDAVKKGSGDKSPKELVAKSNRLKNIVMDYATKIINGDKPEFNSCELAFEEELKKEGISGFTFGNIQKIINMTMKRLYFRYSDSYRERFSCCHAPMDMKMRDIVCKKYRTIYKERLGIETCAWSKMDRLKDGKDSVKSYYDFQDAVEKIINIENSSFLPIEYDYIMFKRDADYKLPIQNPFVV